jgi:hypothetical protein
MRICERKQGTMENVLFEWLCHTQKNSIEVGGQMMTVNAVKTALILKASELYGGGGSKTVWKSVSREGA